MAEIALLVVEDFERTAKKKPQQQQGRGRQELPAGAGDRAASASKASEWGSWAAPTAARGVAAVDGFFSA